MNTQDIKTANGTKYQNLKTMAEKQAEDPNELMENGLTRAQNDKIQKDGENVGAIMWLVSVGFLIYALVQFMSI
jgi:hypothetical protein